MRQDLIIEVSMQSLTIFCNYKHSFKLMFWNKSLSYDDAGMSNLAARSGAIGMLQSIIGLIT